MKPLKEILSKEDLKELYDQLKEDEYESTLDEGWTIKPREEHKQEAEEFLKMTDDEKEKFAEQEGINWANEVIELTLDEFMDMYGDRYDVVMEYAN